MAIMRERERERERERDRQTDRRRERERETDRDRGERDKDRQREKETEREREFYHRIYASGVILYPHIVNREKILLHLSVHRQSHPDMPTPNKRVEEQQT